MEQNSIAKHSKLHVERKRYRSEAKQLHRRNKQLQIRHASAQLYKETYRDKVQRCTANREKRGLKLKPGRCRLTSLDPKAHKLDQEGGFSELGRRWFWAAQ